jgi:hypothetical protein
MVTVSVAMVLGQKGVLNLTSLSEALSIHRYSSTPLVDQVVCPRPSGSSQRTDLGVGGELSSNLLSELGGNASRAFGGRGTLVLHFFYLFTSGVFFVKGMSLSSNSRLFRASDENGHFCKMYLPRAIQ